MFKGNAKDLDEGESVFENSLHDYYQDRPRNSKNDQTDWEKMSLAEFVSQFNVHKTIPKGSSNSIELLNKRGFIVKRTKECVLRYFLRYENETELHRALCILFLPFRNEKKEIHLKNVTELYEENLESIETLRSYFEKHRGITEAIKDIEEKHKNDDKDIFSDDEEDAEETTTAEELTDFENYAKSLAQNQVRKYNEGKESLPDDEYLSMVNSLNSQQRRMFDDFVERISDPADGSPFYLYIGGEAGTGKSFLLKLMIEATNRLTKYSGQKLDKPRSLVVAPTGVAAYIINGNTIDSALGILPQARKTYSQNSASKNANLRFLFEDLKVLFLDEVSMCGNAKFTMMNYRLQDIMGNSLFMGGISVVSTGDFGQLSPVGERMIWENSNLDGRCDISPNHWDENFKIYYLTQKMRSQDVLFSNISDKVRKGICDSDVQKYMHNHVKPCKNESDNEKYALGKLSIIVTTNKERDRINMEKLNQLLPLEKEFRVLSKDESTNVKNAPKLFDQMPLTKTGQLETQLIFRKGAPVMVTSNHQQQKYKNNGIVNGSRGYVDSIQASKENPNEPEIIWVVFPDENTGKLLREDNRALLRTHKPNNPLAVPIRKQRKTFSMLGNASWLREQFPLTLCYAITAHKSQGQTLEEVIIDFTGKGAKIGSGAFYTAMSRVRNGKDLYLKGFSPEYIKAYDFVEEKLNAMKITRPYNFKKIFLDFPVFEDASNELKIGYVNINSLLEGQSVELLNNDRNLINLDFLIIADTRLTVNSKTEDLLKTFPNWNILKRFDAEDDIDHMGLMLLSSKTSEKEHLITSLFKTQWRKPKKSKNMIFAQLLSIKFNSYNKEIGFVYVRETPSFGDVEKISKETSHLDGLIGDINLNPEHDDDRRKLEKLLGNKKQMVLHETTTSKSSQLDHVLLSKNLQEDFYTTTFYNLTTDHRVLTLRLAKNGNKFTEKFNEKINFDIDYRTKVPEANTPKTVDIHRASNLDKDSNKRKKPDQVKTTSKKPRISYRTFKNPDMESCWINCCMQLMLSAFDHLDIQEQVSSERSALWTILSQMLSGESLNPLPLRDIFVQRERERIIEEHVLPQNRLFHYAGTTSVENNVLKSLSEASRIGQQDCKDFFLALIGSKAYWPDICSLFEFSLLKFTTCFHCGQDQRSEHSQQEFQLYLDLDCPQNEMSMSEFIHQEINEPLKVDDWRHEDGCGKKKGGNTFQRIRNLEDLPFLIVIVNRLIQLPGQQLQINKTKLRVTQAIEIKKSENSFVKFKPIAVIHHDGYVSGNDTRGHYMTDVFDIKSSQWLRTSDDAEPKKLETITDQGYIFLYKREK